MEFLGIVKEQSNPEVWSIAEKNRLAQKELQDSNQEKFIQAEQRIKEDIKLA
jgi:hypothetical protein